MQVRSLPSLVLPRLLTNTSQRRSVTPVPAQDERSQPSSKRNLKPQISDAELLASQNQRYSYVRVDAEGSKVSRALQTYFNIEAQNEQERSQTLFGVDILV